LFGIAPSEEGKEEQENSKHQVVGGGSVSVKQTFTQVTVTPTQSLHYILQQLDHQGFTNIKEGMTTGFDSTAGHQPRPRRPTGSQGKRHGYLVIDIRFNRHVVAAF
jgi:hypothetical protein